MKINWKWIFAVNDQLKASSETIHDINFVRELISYLVLSSATSIVETGTERGVTARFLAALFPQLKLYTCDKFLNGPVVAETLRGITNVVCQALDSREFLPLLGKIELGPRPFYFLDAHARNNPNPIREEFQVINEKLAQHEIVEAHICVHDFKVEDKPEFGYNMSDYDGTDLSWETIEDLVRPLAKGVWFPRGEPLTKYSRGRIFIYMSAIQPVLPYNLEYLENLGILCRYL